MKTLQTIENYIVYGLLFLLPLFVFSIFTNPYQTPKLLLLVVAVSTILLIKVVKALNKGSLQFSSGSFDIPVILLALSYLASSWLKTPNKIEAFFLPGTATIFVVGALLYFIVNQMSKDARKGIPIALFSSGIILSIIMLLAGVGIFKSIPQFPAFMKVDDFSPMAGRLAGAIFLATTLPFGISFFRNEKEMAQKAFWGIALAIITFSFIFAFISFRSTSTGLQMPEFGTSWSVTADTLKESPLLGLGGGNYITAFNRFRPISYNATDLWRVRFTSSRSFYLTVITEIGLLGLAALILLVVPFSKRYSKAGHERKLVGWHTLDNTNLASILILGILLILFPANIVLIALLFVLLALNTEKHELTFYSASSTADAGAAVKLPIILVGLPVIILIIAVSYYGGRFLSAEVTYKRALDAIAKNDGKKGYELMQKAINTNPYADRYHTSYAQLNLALANAIATKQDLTDQDRQTITQLIQQAIREGKITVTLNPQRASNWETLARIYQAIIPLAKDADTFAIQTMAQAVSLDPINPDLRIALGGLFYARKDYDSAITAFETAAAFKPDLPNSHYNLAYALNERGNIDRAIREMTTVLSLVNKDSQDYATAQKALEDFESKKKAATPPQGSENLTPPTTPEDQLDPKLDLPEGSEPPDTENSEEEPAEEATTSATPLP